MHKALLFIQQMYISQFGKIIHDEAAHLSQLNIFTDISDIASKYTISRIWFSEIVLWLLYYRLQYLMFAAERSV